MSIYDQLQFNPALPRSRKCGQVCGGWAEIWWNSGMWFGVWSLKHRDRDHQYVRAGGKNFEETRIELLDGIAIAVL